MQIIQSQIWVFSSVLVLAFTAFSLAFWGYSAKQYIKQMILFSILQGTFIGVFIQIFSQPLLFLSSSLFYFLIFIWIFKTITWSYRMMLLLVSYFISAFAENVFVQAEAYLQSIEQTDIHISLMVMAVMILIVIAPLTWLMQRLEWAPGKQIYRFVQNEKSVILLLLFLFLQLLSVFLMVSQRFTSMYIALAISLVIIIFSLKVIAQTRNSAVKMTQRVYIDNTNRLFLTLRSQRHDFLNHVQVIHSYVKRKKYEELDTYTEELFGEVQQFNEILTIGHPALCALIQMKLTSAEEKNIQFNYQFDEMESVELGVKSIDMVKITGNLIDNAFDEVMKLPEEQRWIEVNGWMESNSFHISVENPGKPISKEEKVLFFNPGFSTKSNKDGHSGFGLYIVKERVEHYDGEINVNSSNKGNIFSVRIPLRVSG